MAVLERINSIEDDEERGRTAAEAIENAERYITQARAIRDEAIFRLSQQGRKPYEIAQKFSLSKSAVIGIVRLARARQEAGRG